MIGEAIVSQSFSVTSSSGFQIGGSHSPSSLRSVHFESGLLLEFFCSSNHKLSSVA